MKQLMRQTNKTTIQTTESYQPCSKVGTGNVEGKYVQKTTETNINISCFQVNFSY